jgi:hypothetical protein
MRQHIMKKSVIESHTFFVGVGVLAKVFRDALKLTFQLKRVFDDRRPIAEALSDPEQPRQPGCPAGDIHGLKTLSRRVGSLS